MTAIFLCGDSSEQLKNLPSGLVDLIMTSPPYADNRPYAGVHPNKYVDWFMPISAELFRILKSDGSFVLNIKERVVSGERHTYVLELIQALRNQGWLWTEEYIWHKKNCYPGKWPNRFRDAWERCLHFTKAKQFHMYQEAVMLPVGDWADSRLSNLSETDGIRDSSKVGSGFGKNVSNWVGRSSVYPSNVLHLATECSNSGHSASFPPALPDWFIRLFTADGDTVLDPFSGAGTTAMVAERLGCNSINIDISAEYIALAEARLAEDETKRLSGKK